MARWPAPSCSLSQTHPGQLVLHPTILLPARPRPYCLGSKPILPTGSSMLKLRASRLLNYGSLRAAMAGVFTPQKVANSTNSGTTKSQFSSTLPLGFTPAVSQPCQSALPQFSAWVKPASLQIKHWHPQKAMQPPCSHFCWWPQCHRLRYLSQLFVLFFSTWIWESYPWSLFLNPWKQRHSWYLFFCWFP